MRKILNYNYNEYILRRVKVFGMLCDCEIAKWSFCTPGGKKKRKTDFQNFEAGGQFRILGLTYLCNPPRSNKAALILSGQRLKFSHNSPATGAIRTISPAKVFRSSGRAGLSPQLCLVYSSLGSYGG